MEQFSERRSDGVSTRRLSEDARSGSTRNQAKNLAIFLPNKLFPKEPLGNPCINWLPMLYYEGSRLNGLWSPFGIEGVPCACWKISQYSRLNGLWSPFGIEGARATRQ